MTIQVIWWRNKNFNAVSHNCSRPEVLFLNLTWRSRGQISSVLLQLLLFAFSNRKFERHGKWCYVLAMVKQHLDRTWLWDTALKYFGRAFSLRHHITWMRFRISMPDGPDVIYIFSIISELNKEFPAIWLVEAFLIWRYINRSRGFI